MNDIVYLTKITSLSVCIFLILELFLYVFFNRNDKLKAIKRTQLNKTIGFRLSLLFCMGFCFAIIALIMNIILIRCLYLGTPINLISGVNDVLSISNIIFYVVFTLILNGIRKNIRYDSKSRISLNLICTGSLLLIFGSCFMLSYPAFLLIQDLWIIEVEILISVLLIGAGVVSIKSFNELYPVLYADEVHLTTSDCQVIVSCQFSEQKSDQQANQTNPQGKIEEGVFGSSILGIDGLLREISATQGSIKTLVHQNRILLIERSANVFGIFVTRIELDSIRSQLNAWIRDIELTYAEDFKNKNHLSLETRNYLKDKINKWYHEEMNKNWIGKKFFLK